MARDSLLDLLRHCLGCLNRFHLVPRICREAGALRALCRTVCAEQGLGLGILAVVSVLGTWPPA